jgi:hypothetical protein
MGHHRLRAKPTTDRRWSAPPEGIAAALPGRSCRTRPQQSGRRSTNSIDLRNSISPKGSFDPDHRAEAGPLQAARPNATSVPDPCRARARAPGWAASRAFVAEVNLR